MADISDKIKDFKFVVKAGMIRESMFRHIESSNPNFNKIENIKYFRELYWMALNEAKEIVEQTGKNITLRYSVVFDD